MKNLFPQSWSNRAKAVFQQGLTPREMALSISIGAVVGVMPFFGITTAVVTGIVLWLRLNVPLSIFITYAVSPLHVLLFIPFIRLGECFFGDQDSMLSWAHIKNSFQTDYIDAVLHLSQEIGYGILAWSIIAIPAILILYKLLHVILVLLERNRTKKIVFNHDNDL